METFGAAQKFIEPYIKEHKSTLDSDNIRDFIDLTIKFLWRNWLVQLKQT
jgi:hypothetical protein